MRKSPPSKHESMALVLAILKENPAIPIIELARQYNIPHATITGAWRTYKQRIKTDEEFQQIIQKHYKPEQYTTDAPHGHTVLFIPDLHCPFEHVDALDFLRAVKKKFRPTKIICAGDEVDAHAYSKWPKDPDGLSAGKELQAAKEALVPFYIEFPEVMVCVSNHTIRPQKMMTAIGLPAAFFPSYSTMLNAPDKWTWHEHIIVDGVRYMHGDQGKAGQNGWTKNSEVYHQSTVVGHWHSKAGVYYDSLMFNVNAGCLIDTTAYAFGYSKNSHKKANLGCAIIINGREGHFIPMHLDTAGRWTGVVNG